jgi:hypothetical protein
MVKEHLEGTDCYVVGKENENYLNIEHCPYLEDHADIYIFINI